MNTQSPPTASAASPEPEVIKTGQCPPGGWPSDNLHAAMAKLGELREYVSYFIAAKVDGIKVSLRNAAIYAALGLIGAVAGVAVIAVAVVLLLVGAAHAIGAALGGMWWLGDLIVGALLLIAIGIGAILGLKMLTHSFKKSTVDKYETRQHQQRRDFGHDVEQRAQEERGTAAR